MYALIIKFDGGCRPTNPGNKYGSYQVELPSGEIVHAESRFELGWGTNNEAEFEALRQALNWTLTNLKLEGFEPITYALEIHTDSTILKNRIDGKYALCKTEPQQRMAKLSASCNEYLKHFGAFRVVWEKRDSNVATFGH